MCTILGAFSKPSVLPSSSAVNIAGVIKLGNCENRGLTTVAAKGLDTISFLPFKIENAEAS